MELIKGGSLKNLIQQYKRFNDEEASQIIRGILNAVEHVHSKTYVHWDLKPDNILIDYDEQGHIVIKLADFGLGAQFRLNCAY